MINDLIGAPYKRNGRDPETGIDCWGLTALVLRRMGTPIGRDWEPATLAEGHRLMTEQAVSGDWDESDGQPGDVVALFRHGVVVHIGVVVFGGILHTVKGSGAVLQSVRALQRSFGYSDLRFYRWNGAAHDYCL